MKLELNSSFGAAAQVGIDIEVITGWSLNVDARWFDIDTDARMGGVDVGTIAMDPYALGVSLGYRF
jgi:outer membrane protein